MMPVSVSSWLLTKHYQLSGAMRNANKEACRHGGQRYPPRKRSSKNNAVRAASIHSNRVDTAAIAAQFRDNSSGAPDASQGRKQEIALATQPSLPPSLVRGNEPRQEVVRRHISRLHGVASLQAQGRLWKTG
jgi:hypothetical protein